MKIACCDDTSTDLELLVDYCERYDSEFQICTYTSAKDMLDAYPSVLFDIVFLDIEMDHSNGYEAAVQLSHEPDPPIVIFTTRSLNYAVRGYGLATKYLPKPVTYEQFSQALSLAIDQKTPPTINIITDNKIEILTVSDINYVEVSRHQVTVHLLSKPDIHLRCSFSAILDKLPDNWFVQAHKSYCVNLHSVMRMEQNSLTLIDNTQIPIGRNYKTQLKERLMEFLKGSC